MINFEQWEGFEGRIWKEEVNVRDFIQKNYTPYDGDGSFLAPATGDTKKLWKEICDLSEKERKAGGVLSADTKIVSSVNSHEAGYIDKAIEKIVGLQTDEPFKRPMHVSGGLRMAEQALEVYGYKVDPEIHDFYKKFRKTHNDGVFDVYTPEMRHARTAHILTGLPDAYAYRVRYKYR